MLNGVAPWCCATPCPAEGEGCPAEWVCNGQGEGGWHHRTRRPKVLEGRNGGKSCWAVGFSSLAAFPAAGALAVGKDREDCATSTRRSDIYAF